jgi:hypothetical protein
LNAPEQLPDGGRNSNIFEEKAVSEKWGQKNESHPHLSTPGRACMIFLAEYF